MNQLRYEIKQSHSSTTIWFRNVYQFFSIIVNLLVLGTKLKLNILKKKEIKRRLNLDKLKQEEIRANFEIKCRRTINNCW